MAVDGASKAIGIGACVLASMHELFSPGLTEMYHCFSHARRGSAPWIVKTPLVVPAPVGTTCASRVPSEYRKVASHPMAPPTAKAMAVTRRAIHISVTAICVRTVPLRAMARSSVRPGVLKKIVPSVSSLCVESVSNTGSEPSVV